MTKKTKKLAILLVALMTSGSMFFLLHATMMNH